MRRDVVLPAGRDCPCGYPRVVRGGVDTCSVYGGRCVDPAAPLDPAVEVVLARMTHAARRHRPGRRRDAPNVHQITAGARSHRRRPRSVRRPEPGDVELVRSFPYTVLEDWLLTHAPAPPHMQPVTGRVSIGWLARLADVDPTTVKRWRDAAVITDDNADWLAGRLGVHAAEIWPEWALILDETDEEAVA